MSLETESLRRELVDRARVADIQYQMLRREFAERIDRTDRVVDIQYQTLHNLNVRLRRVESPSLLARLRSARPSRTMRMTGRR